MEIKPNQTLVLLITSSDYGQANVMLSVAQQLLQASAVTVHIASTATLSSQVAQLGRSAHFHLLPSRSMFEGYVENGHDINELPHPPGMLGAVSSFNNVPKMMRHWMDGRYLDMYSACFLLIRELAPTVVVVDPVCAPEIDACRMLNQNLIILSR